MSKEKTRHKVFVYGTLRPEGVRATHKLFGYLMYNYHNRFPYIIPDPQRDSWVYGNILEVTNKELKQLDRIEGIDAGLYRRISVDVMPVHGMATIPTWVYVAGNIAPTPIPRGDWIVR